MHGLQSGVFVAILVALISGVFSLVGLIISKEAKLSEFRQAWIDALREDLSNFTAHAVMISAYCKAVLAPVKLHRDTSLSEANGDRQRVREIEDQYRHSIKEYFEATRKDYSGINTCSTRIKLRLTDRPA